ncbi:FG-GAP-like repeat-containing protein [Desulfobacter latus]|uniref:VCBS repeat-containing protein n=1 Tax=Desulfobacter latus TaxID=2292 RepID=A0A850T6F8_9BACT|nr:FG-GAP-like repeat-containing protein [Desulfobacter latus]NWH04575.1 VCBS repeat-containing protein [Desulfobacter latus]
MRQFMQTFFAFKIIVVVLTFFTFWAAAGTGLCRDAKTVAVFPFEMNSSQDLGFLQNGLFSMLSSRLSDAGKVDVLDRQTIDSALARAKAGGLVKGAFNEGTARDLGAQMGVDYVLFGSLTHYGESISLDASMVDVSGQKDTLAFFEQSNAMGDVIPLVNAFAGDINMKVFNRNIDNKLYARPQEQNPSLGGLQYAGGGGMPAMQASRGFTTHLKMDEVIRAMATGDLNKDGRLQVVTATDSALQIYHLEGNLFTREIQLDYASYLRIIGLDVADINGNGYPEIFVTAMTIHRQTLSSFVVEYNGSSYTTLQEGLSYYFRVIDSVDGNPVLYAQDKGRGPYAGKIYIMSPANNTYREEKAIRVPRGTSVLSLARGPVRENSGDEFLSINQHHRLVLINDTGSDEWESTEKYGKTNNYWITGDQAADRTVRDRAYFNPRIKFHSVGEDRKKKVFLIKNSEFGAGSLGRIKRFKEGRVDVMSWNGIALAPVFQTVPLQGWVSDFDIADIDNDGIEELLISVVTRSKIAILAKDKTSNIISYELKN